MTADRPVRHWPGRMVDLGDGAQVYVAQPPWSQDGERDLVLCVHGMSGAATNWTDLMAELAPDFDCAAVDLPGSGLLGAAVEAQPGYSIRSLAATVIRLIEALGRGPVHLVGNSMGGAVAVRAAAGRPDLIKTLTLVSPALPDRRPARLDRALPDPGAALRGRGAGPSLVIGAGREPGSRRVQQVLLRSGRPPP